MYVFKTFYAPLLGVIIHAIYNIYIYNFRDSYVGFFHTLKLA